MADETTTHNQVLTAGEIAAKAKAEAEAALTPEQQEVQSAYQRAKLLHLHNYGADPDKEIVKLPDGTDDHGRMKFKEWDFRKPAGEAPPAEGTTTTEATETTPAAEEVKPAAKPKKAKTPKPAPQPAPAPTAEEIADKVAEKVKPPEPKPPTLEDQLELDDEDREQLAVFAAMEESPRNKGLKEKVLKFWQREQERKRKYETDNPGQVYNPADAEHQSFYAEEPPYDEREFNRTAIRQEAQRIVQKDREAGNEKVTALETQIRMRDEMPEIVAREMAGKGELVVQLFPKETEQLAGEDGFAITPETVKKLEEAVSPLEFAVLNEKAEELGVVLSELDKLGRYSKVYKADPNKAVTLRVSGQEFRPHAELMNFSDWLENALATDPNNQRDGKAFLRPDEWNQRIRKGEKNLAERFYTLTDSDVRVALIAEYARRGQNAIADARKWADLAGKKNGTQQPPAAAAAPAPKPAPAPAPAPRIKPPSSATASDRVNTTTTPAPSEAEKLEYLQQVY